MEPLAQHIRLENIWALALTIIGIAIATQFLTTLTFSSSSKDAERKPQTIPYWLPWIGHGVELLVSKERFLRASRGSTHQSVFAVRSFGKKYTVIFSPSHRRQLKPHLESDDHNVITRKAAVACGVPKVNQLIEDDMLADVGVAFHKHFSDAASQDTLVQNTTLKLQAFIPQLVSFLPSLVDQHVWERESVAVTGEEDVVHADLNTLIPRFLLHSVTPVITGSTLLDVYPNILTDFESFRFAYTLISHGLPRWIPIPRLTTAHIARKNLLDKMADFHRAMQISYGNDSGTMGEWGELSDISDPLLDCFKLYEKHKLPLRTRAALDLCNLSSINLGINTLCTKVLLRIVQSPSLVAELRDEIAPFAQVIQPIAILGIAEPPRLTLNGSKLASDCTLLRSTITETIRTDTFPESESRTTSEAKVSAPGGASYVIGKNERVLFTPGLHFTNKASFKNPLTWDPSRFVTEPGRAREVERFWEEDMGWPGSPDDKQPSFMLQQCVTFLAGVLALWDIELLAPGVSVVKIRKRNLKKVQT